MPMIMRTTTGIDPTLQGSAGFSRSTPCVDEGFPAHPAGAATHGVALLRGIRAAMGFSRSTPCVDEAFPMNPADAATHCVALLQ